MASAPGRLLVLISISLAFACSDDPSGDSGSGVATAGTGVDDGVVDGITQTAGPDDGVDDGIDDGGTMSTAGTTANDSDDSNGTTDGDDDATDSLDGTTTNTTPQPPVCMHQCGAPADCFIDGEELGLECLDGLCGFGCTDDQRCIAATSGWLNFDCQGDGDCGGGACVDIGDGTGGCALTPALGACSEANLVEMQATSLGGGNVTVCGQPNGRCGDFNGTNACFVGCDAAFCGDMECGGDGLCHCDFDTHCTEAGLGNNCNATTGLCEWACQEPANCPPSPFDGGMLLCELP